MEINFLPLIVIMIIMMIILLILMFYSLFFGGVHPHATKDFGSSMAEVKEQVHSNVAMGQIEAHSNLRASKTCQTEPAPGGS